jgi:hypothetical protein|tara:strand:- start:2768 stop:3187 length:420 start_codon:yes stop_codon:yes gene_type:complete
MAGTYVDNWSNRYATNQWVWWTERDAVGIAKFNPNSERFTSPSAEQAGKKITLFYYKKASQFTEPSSASYSWTAVSDFPSQFHDYIVAKAIALGYEKKPEQLQLAMYFHEKFEKGVKEGRNYAYRGRTGTVKYIKPVSF